MCGDPKHVSEQLLSHYGSIADIYRVCILDEKPLAGVSPVVAARLRHLSKYIDAAFHLETTLGPIVSDFNVLVNRLSLDMAGLPRETFRVLFLNAENRLLGDQVMWEGTVRNVQVYPREVVRRIIEVGATAVIFAHNHPSGDPTPSRGDIEITHKLVQACSTIDVLVHDHIVVAQRGHVSMRKSGLLTDSIKARCAPNWQKG